MATLCTLMVGTFAISQLARPAYAHVGFDAPKAATWDASTDFVLRVPHGGGDNLGTTALIVELPEGTYNTKPTPAYGYDLSITTRTLDPPRGLWGHLSNTTVDMITWKAVDGFALPNWAIGFFQFATVFTPQEGLTKFNVYQQFEDSTWRNWTMGDATVKPVELPTSSSSTAEAAAATPSATEANSTHDMADMATAGAEDHSGHGHRRAEEGENPAPALMIVSPEELANMTKADCGCDTSALEQSIADLKATVDALAAAMGM